MRTNATAVKAILVYNYDFKRNPDLTGFMDSASNIVDRVVSDAVVVGVAVTDVQAELIERWLSAYFYCKMDPLYTTKSTQGASGSFVTSTSLEAEQERYKRGAIELDPSGCLHAILNRNVATARRLGTVCPSRYGY